MAEYRTVHTRIWDDPWFAGLEYDAKLLWLYLITNHKASVAGIYILRSGVAAADTSIRSKRVEQLLRQFETDGKILREGNVVWVAKLRDYQQTTSGKVQTRIQKDVAGIPDCGVKRRYLEHYSGGSYGIDTLSDAKNQEKTAPKPSGESVKSPKTSEKTAPKPKRCASESAADSPERAQDQPEEIKTDGYPIDTLSIPYRLDGRPPRAHVDTDTDTVTDTPPKPPSGAQQPRPPRNGGVGSSLWDAFSGLARHCGKDPEQYSTRFAHWVTSYGEYALRQAITSGLSSDEPPKNLGAYIDAVCAKSKREASDPVPVFLAQGLKPFDRNGARYWMSPADLNFYEHVRENEIEEMLAEYEAKHADRVIRGGK